MSTFKALLASLLALVLAVLASSASPAFAQSPWFHLTSGALPTNIKPGVAANEVQKLTVNATGGPLVLERTEAGHEGFAFVAYNAPAAAVQSSLEAVYGEHAVEVSGGPVGEPPIVGTGLTEPYLITFTGELADRPVAPISTEFSVDEGLKGEATDSEVTKGSADGQLIVTVANLGDAPVVGSQAPVQIADTLPAGLHATGIEAFAGAHEHGPGADGPVECSLEGLTCTYHEGTLPPYSEIELVISVVVAGAPSGEDNVASVSGGGAPPAHLSRPVTVSGEPTPFGIEDYEMTAEEEGGALDTLAGSHPFQLTTTLNLNDVVDQEGAPVPAGLPKDVHIKWPAGLIGDPTAVARCSLGQFLELKSGSERGAPLSTENACPPQSAVGVAVTTIHLPGENFGPGAYTLTDPVFNLEPELGEPAKFGFLTPGVPVYINPAVRSGEDYGIDVNVENISQEAAFLRSDVTIWGVPGDARHDESRGNGCLGSSGSCNLSFEEQQPPAFLSLPTSCPTNPATGAPEPLQSTIAADSWERPGEPVAAREPALMPALDGCNRLPFEPTITVKPDGTAASSPSGVTVDVHVSQAETLNAGGLAVADPRNITVTFPQGLALNPAGGDGLQACSGDPADQPATAGNLIGFTGIKKLESLGGAEVVTFSPRLPGSINARDAGEQALLEPGIDFCPNASKIGEVTIHTPILPNPIVGSVYLATQNANPFGSLVAVYIVAEDPVSGVLIKLAGQVHLTETGQIVSTFENSPQAPFEDAVFHFYGGERAPMSTPARCGTYTSTAAFTSWSAQPGEALHIAQNQFSITSGSNGSPCPGASLPFSPSLTSSSSNVNAGAFSNLATTIGRADGNQDLQSVTLHYPPGLSGLISGVTLCPEAQANAGTCTPASQIGETVVSAGVGSDPVTVTGGKVFLTESYHGAPYGLSIVNPVKAGPFDLEHDTANPNQDPACDCVVVRAKIEVDPLTAALTVTTNEPSEGYAIPHIVDGIPAQIQHVNVLINRPGFTFNPTNCNKMEVTGAIKSDEGSSAEVRQPFAVTNCAALKFEPKISVSTSGRTSKASGASLTTAVTEPAGSMGTQTNIAKVKVDLPKQLPSRLTTLQKACTSAQFNLNPAGCPAESKVGYAVVNTPLLPVSLTGPAIFVSHGGEAFPSLTMVLQGDNVTIDLVGTTNIKNGITSTTFKATPDQPFSTFRLTLPEGKFSALAANADLCKANLVMPTAFVGQDGAEIHEDTKVGVTECKQAITVIRHSSKGATATIAVRVPSAGTLVATGKGLSRATTRTSGTATLTVKLALSAKEREFLAAHHGHKLATTIRLRFMPVKGSILSTSVRMLIG